MSEAGGRDEDTSMRMMVMGPMWGPNGAHLGPNGSPTGPFGARIGPIRPKWGPEAKNQRSLKLAPAGRCDALRTAKEKIQVREKHNNKKNNNNNIINNNNNPLDAYVLP